MDTNTQNKPTPHPHAELIKDWADGAKIQFRYSEGTLTTGWQDDEKPVWNTEQGCEYRIKPEEPKAQEPWKPKDEENYFFINGSGMVYANLWFDCATDKARYDFGNCFRTREEAEAAAELVKIALKNYKKIQTDVIGMLDGREKILKDFPPIDIVNKEKLLNRVKAALKGEVVPVKELEALKTRNENLHKAKEVLINKQTELDGKPLTDGEVALIKALRRGRIFQQYVDPRAVVVEALKDGNMKIHHEFVAFCMHSCGDTARIRSALKQIQAEQEAKND